MWNLLSQRKQYLTKGKFILKKHKCNFSSGVEISYKICTVVLKIICIFSLWSIGPCNSGFRTSARSPNESWGVGSLQGVPEQVHPMQLVPTIFSLSFPLPVHLIVPMPFTAGGIHQCPSFLWMPLTGAQYWLAFFCVLSVVLPWMLMLYGVLRESYGVLPSSRPQARWTGLRGFTDLDTLFGA